MSTPPPNTLDLLQRHFQATSGHRPRLDQDLFASGQLNSLHALQLVVFLEETFDIELEDEDLSRENFSTLRALEALVQLRQRT
jgi:methoxymalonate biosynthesis acyl carrier protein